MSDGDRVSTGLAIAPTPPGRLGEAADPTSLLAYLRTLRDWVAQRKRELDGIDAAATRSSDPDDYVGDITLSMALWQSVNERAARLDQLWDAGRAGAVTREQMSQVIWGRLGSPGPGGTGGAAPQLSLSVVEACRLSDALAAQLRNRLSFDPRASDAALRVAALRAALERLRELVKQEPSWGPQVDLLATRVADMATRAARGGDVDVALHDLEVDAARAERDLVVTTATRLRDARSREAAQAELVADRSRAASEVAALGHRRTRLLALVERCIAEITPAPRFAVPDVAVLGPVPQAREELDDFTHRLDTVMRAMDVVEDAYSSPLAEREELAGLLSGYQAMALRQGRAADPAVAVASGRAEQSLAATPCDIAAARLAVTTFRELVSASAAGGGSAASARAEVEPAVPGRGEGRRDPAGHLTHRSERMSATPSTSVDGRLHAAPSRDAAGPSSTGTATSADRRPVRPPPTLDRAGRRGRRRYGDSPSSASKITSSNRLASAPIGSARAGGTRATRSLGTGSTRLRGARLGAGLTYVPPVPAIDPEKALLVDPEVAGEPAVLPELRQPGGPLPGRAAGPAGGVLPAVPQPVLVHARSSRPATWWAASTRWPAASPTAGWAGSTWRGT